MADQLKVVLITKLRTTNLGNEALSTEALRLYAGQYGAKELAVIGRPVGLEAYTLHRLLRAGANPVMQLERWAQRIAQSAEKLKAQRVPIRLNAHPIVELYGLTDPEVRLNGLRALYRPIRSALAKLGPYRPSYTQRLRVIVSADRLVYSGAGEVTDQELFLRQLVELRAAELCGVRVAAVNQSVVLRSPIYRTLTAHVYSAMERIVVRGERSRGELIDMGVPSEKLSVAPDTAFLSEPFDRRSDDNQQHHGFGTSTVGLALNGDKIDRVSDWGPVIDRLRSAGHTVVFLTNDPWADRAAANEFKRQLAVKVFCEKCSYREYMSVLKGMHFVISSRLHTNELALAAGTPVIPLEGHVFKTREVFELIEYPLTVIDTGEAGWVRKIQDAIDLMSTANTAIREYAAGRIARIRSASQLNLIT